jgi:hypothetical protein
VPAGLETDAAEPQAGSGNEGAANFVANLVAATVDCRPERSVDLP